MEFISCDECSDRSQEYHGQLKRCHRCSKLISTRNGQLSESLSTVEIPIQECNYSTTESKGLRDYLKKKTSALACVNPSISFSVPEPPPRGKRALLCGVSYKRQKFRLRGTIQDVRSMRDFLIARFSFPPNSILILTEEDQKRLPTKKNILEAFKWLMSNLQYGDSLVFYFSGHGLRQPDYSADELDGFDETICPVDFETAGMIVDNDINEAIVRPLKQGVTLHAIIDACHSGTVLDLPHIYSNNKKKWESNHPPSGAYKGTSGGRAISFSACEDYQLAADTSAFSPGKTMNGAMTYTFIKAVNDNPEITYLGLLHSISKTIEEVMSSKSRCLNSGLRRLCQRKILQEPVLSSSEEFNVNSKFKL